MSTIYFSTPDDQAELYGGERHWMSVFTVNIGLSPLSDSDVELFDNYMTLAYSVSTVSEFETAIIGSSATTPPTFELNNKSYDIYDVVLNTAMDVGNEVIEFLCRLHGQIEMNMFIEPQYKKRTANIIKLGLEDNILDNDINGNNKGWKDVIELLKKDNDNPVVTSWSVTRSFPDKSYWTDDKDFYDSDIDKRWDVCYNNLKKQYETDDGYNPLSYEPDRSHDNRIRYSSTENLFSIRKKIQRLERGDDDKTTSNSEKSSKL